MEDNKIKKKSILTPIFIGIITGILLKMFIFDIEKVSGTSMYPTLKEGQTVVINKLAYGICKPFKNDLLLQWRKPKKNDIVVYIFNNKPVVKRCVAIQNEPLEFSSDSDYSLYVGDKVIPLTERQFQRIKYNNTVPNNTILAVGDNYNSSIDSRDYGFVKTECILGKVLCK